MVETSVRIPNDNGFLEALYREGQKPDVAILCHPHPLYGGTMDNNVVVTLQKTFARRGWGTLRFNFRAAGGNSDDSSLGERAVEDLAAVIGHLKAQGLQRLHVAGYSFGAWIALKAVKHGFLPESAVLISPPLDFLPFDAFPASLLSRPCLITLGERDNFCSLESLHQWLGDQPRIDALTKVAVFPKADHFYWGSEEALSEKLTAFLERFFQPPAA